LDAQRFEGRGTGCDTDYGICVNQLGLGNGTLQGKLACLRVHAAILPNLATVKCGCTI